MNTSGALLVASAAITLATNLAKNMKETLAITPTYVGDGVYVQTDSFGSLVLTTGNHDPAKAENVIVLEPQVWAQLTEIISKALT